MLLCLFLVILDVKISPITTGSSYRRPQKSETKGTDDQKAWKNHSWVVLGTHNGTVDALGYLRPMHSCKRFGIYACYPIYGSNLKKFLQRSYCPCTPQPFHLTWKTFFIYFPARNKLLQCMEQRFASTNLFQIRYRILDIEIGRGRKKRWKTS